MTRMPWIARLAEIVDRSFVLSTLNYAKGQILYGLRVRGHFSGSTHRESSIEEAADYVLGVFEDYLQYAQVRRSFIAGKHILEVGPGDNLGLALCFLAHGAASVTALDKYASVRDPEHIRELHVEVLRRLPSPGREVAAAALRELEESGKTDGRLRHICGVGIETSATAFPNQRFDVIVSRAVLQHVPDLPSAWHAMVDLLGPRGELWHKVDLRSHKYYETIHPLRFLCVRDFLWKLVSSPDPTLNRARYSDYVALCERSMPSQLVWITQVIGRQELVPHTLELERGSHYGCEELERIQEVRPKLAARFMDASDRDLLVAGIFVIGSRGRELPDDVSAEEKLE